MWKRIYLTDLKQYCLLRFPLQMQEKHPRAFCLSDCGSPDWMGEHRAKLGTLQARDTRSPWYGAEPQVGSAPWWQSKWLFGNHSHAEGNFKDSIVNSVDSMPVIQEATYLWNVLVGECSGRGQGYEGDSRRGRSSISCDLIAWACMETAEGTGIQWGRLLMFLEPPCQGCWLIGRRQEEQRMPESIADLPEMRRLVDDVVQQLMLNLKTVNVIWKHKWFIYKTTGALKICSVMTRDTDRWHVWW